MTPTDNQPLDLAVLGLAVMGQNLALNFRDKGYRVAVYNRSPDVTERFLSEASSGIVGFHSLSDLVGALARPRKLLLLVRSGPPVDAVIRELRPLLDPEDIVVDLGNSHHSDSERRYTELRDAGLRFVACGISGGEEGARHGPSLMPGGDEAAWPALKEMFSVVAAKADDEPCVAWIGQGGAGHFVKMVHNGIEYGDMQLICEAYDLLRRGLGLAHKDISEQFRRWNQGPLSSYLIEITAHILAREDGRGLPLVEQILDVAGQKGTGTWTGIEALQLGAPAPLVAEAVFARGLSARKEERQRAADLLTGPRPMAGNEPGDVIESLEQALYAGKIVSYAQGFSLMQMASEQRNWALDPGRIAAIWRAGCIIRSPFLNHIRSAYAEGNLESILFSPFFMKALADAQAGWRRTVSFGTESGIPLPAMSSALAFYDGLRSRHLPANLLQAQRDAFGAHGYERVDRPRGEHFHTDWLGEAQ